MRLAKLLNSARVTSLVLHMGNVSVKPWEEEML